MIQPKSAADRRPNDQPYYIDPACPNCGSDLIYANLLDHPPPPFEEFWFDEFICPVCQDGIFIDWPNAYWQSILEQDDLDCVWLEEVKSELDLEDSDS